MIDRNTAEAIDRWIEGNGDAEPRFSDDPQIANFIYDVLFQNHSARHDWDTDSNIVDQEVGHNEITFKWNDQIVRITVESMPLD